MRVLVGYWLINILPLVSRETKKANLPTCLDDNAHFHVAACCLDDNAFFFKWLLAA